MVKAQRPETIVESARPLLHCARKIGTEQAEHPAQAAPQSRGGRLMPNAASSFSATLRIVSVAAAAAPATAGWSTVAVAPWPLGIGTWMAVTVMRTFDVGAADRLGRSLGTVADAFGLADPVGESAVGSCTTPAGDEPLPDAAGVCRPPPLHAVTTSVLTATTRAAILRSGDKPVPGMLLLRSLTSG